MCGITGWINVDIAPEAAQSTLARMCETMLHRGPDDHGAYVGREVALGMQRLAIIDLGGGHQPMASADGAIQVVFNGEIYNHAELRARLIARGAQFRTQSDTEVILRTYEYEGREGFRKFNGMFAIALWDGRSRALHLVRDRLGIKPLYYARRGTGVVFGSEIKAIMESGLVAKEVNRRAIWDYLTLRYVPAPETIWRDVFKLPAGHWMTINVADRAPRIERWWDMVGEQRPCNASDDELLEEFTALFEDAVDLRMVADVPVGIMLSGGLDSGAVAAAAARNGAAVETFAVAFEGASDIDEREYARVVSKHLGTHHREIEIGRREFLDFLPQFVHLTDEPLADLASIPLHYVSRLARGSVKVALSGEGSDEIFGGYTFDRWAALWDQAAAVRKHRAFPGLKRASAVLARVSPRFARSAAVDVETDLRRLPVPLVMTNYATSAEKRAWLRDGVEYPDSHDRSRADLVRIGDNEPLNQALYVYCQDWLVEDLLMKADRMSMATSLELRTPFLDYRLVEWAWRLPPRLKVGPDPVNYRTKLILRRYAATRLPQAIIDRPKLGFPVPVYDWLSGDLAGWVRDLLGPGARVRDFLHDAAIDEMFRCGTAVQADGLARHRLWHLIILEQWMRQWL